MYVAFNNIRYACDLGFLKRLNGVVYFRMAYGQLRVGRSPLNCWLYNSLLLSNSPRMAAEKKGEEQTKLNYGNTATNISSYNHVRNYACF